MFRGRTFFCGVSKSFSIFPHDVPVQHGVKESECESNPSENGVAWNTKSGNKHKKHCSSKERKHKPADPQNTGRVSKDAFAEYIKRNPELLLVGLRVKATFRDHGRPLSVYGKKEAQARLRSSPQEDSDSDSASDTKHGDGMQDIDLEDQTLQTEV